MLTQEQANNYFEYKDGHIYWKIDKSRIAKKGKLAGTLSKRDGRYRTICDGKQYLNHRIIFLMHHGYLSEEIDHINGNPSDNKIENLRLVDYVANALNKKCRISNTGIRGISKDRNYYKVSFTVKNKSIHVRNFKELEKAKKVAKEYYNKIVEEAFS